MFTFPANSLEGGRERRVVGSGPGSDLRNISLPSAEQHWRTGGKSLADGNHHSTWSETLVLPQGSLVGLPKWKEMQADYA